MYKLFLFFYSLGIKIVSVGNWKAKKWREGRKNIFNIIRTQFTASGFPVVWMHCASLGEFEQGRPVLEKIKRQYPDVQTILTFFSPSGYEVAKNYTGADFIFYLPMDSQKNAEKFINIIRPSLVLWIKYEYWFFYLKELKKKNIPVLLVSAIFRQSQPFFKWYGKIWKEMLHCFAHCFVQNETSKKLLDDIGINKHISIIGDTRFDRVITIAENFKAVPFIDSFCGNSMVIVAGSTWEEDEIELLHFIKIHKEIKFIIAPHEVDKDNLGNVKKEFPNSIFYSELEKNGGEYITENVLIIDNVGMLSKLYHYASIAYVGGGFGVDGVHNVLEAAVYGKPVIIGPVYDKFDEAVGLVEAEGALVISNLLKLEAALENLINDSSEIKRRGDAGKKFVYEKSGASEKIVQFIQEKRLLTN